VVVDQLANPELLLETRRGVEIVQIDARLAHTRSERTALVDCLVDLGRSGKKVVRLKGGDAYLFGRGGEEAEALKDAGISFDVVPGVPSAFSVPASAGIPVTDRRHSKSVLITTGQVAKDAEPVDFVAMAKSAETLVVFMGLKKLPSIVVDLLKGGLDPQTPAAVISKGTLPGQRTVTAPLQSLVGAVENAKLQTPALLVVGSVVSLRKVLSMEKERPLFGQRVVVTRPRSQATGFVQGLMDLGAEPLILPTIVVASVTPDEKGDAALSRASEFDAIFFTSTNSVRRTFECFEAAGTDLRCLSGVQVIAIGSATAAALKEHGIIADLMPRKFSSEGICEALGSEGIKGRRFLYPKARHTRGTLEGTIPQEGGHLEAVVLYETLSNAIPESHWPPAMVQGEVDWFTFTSPSTVRGFLELLGKEGAQLMLEKAKVIAIGQTTADALSEHFQLDIIVPEKSTIEFMLKAIETHSVA
jgi:uroporphyrinogen III methyltransferase/synthase